MAFGNRNIQITIAVMTLFSILFMVYTYMSVQGSTNGRMKKRVNSDSRHIQNIVNDLGFKWGPTQHRLITDSLINSGSVAKGSKNWGDLIIASSSRSTYSSMESLDSINNNQDNNNQDSNSQDDNNNNSNYKCKNTKQSVKYIVDDQGLICTRDEMDSNGCCLMVTKDQDNHVNSEYNIYNSIDENDIDSNNNNNNQENQSNMDNTKIIDKSIKDFNSFSSRYSCHGCSLNAHCCGEYEFCVSCCMGGDKIKVLEQTLVTLYEMEHPAYPKDQFDLCTIACRTSSHSVVHYQNEYLHPDFKYCYASSA